ncbi:hypothetical protein AB0B31_06390 [Catellatospora citrea]|uniref:hypothetical protein n=1 Tax=Catellatospora citrea TaxID=53366 RepID=UPI0033C4F3C1
MYLFDADSVVVSTAVELLRVHQPASVEDPSCGGCGEPAPCAVATNAMQIRSAADLAAGFGEP